MGKGGGGGLFGKGSPSAPPAPDMSAYNSAMERANTATEAAEKRAAEAEAAARKQAEDAEKKKKAMAEAEALRKKNIAQSGRKASILAGENEDKLGN